MRASDLLGKRVIGADGARIGVVIDLICEVDDPSRPDPTRLRVDRLLVADRPIASLLGYERAAQRGPWLLAALVTRLYGRVTSVPWAKVDALGHDIRLHP